MHDQHIEFKGSQVEITPCHNIIPVTPVYNRGRKRRKQVFLGKLLALNVFSYSNYYIEFINKYL